MINRDTYLEKLINAKDTDYVKLLVGVRRSGKTTLLKMMQAYLLNNNISEEQIVEINYEMTKFDLLRDGEELHKFIKEKSKNKKIYLFLDEVQEIKEWARVVNSLRVSFDIDIYATGSNARMFIGEHLTYLAGRYLTIRVYPLSYNEFLKFSKINNNSIKHYNDFLFSSFPSVVLGKNQVIKNQLKEDIFSTIFERDIILRGKITRENDFFAIARYILEHIGKPISINKIYQSMKSNNLSISYESVNTYVDLMVKSYFLYECMRYDVKGKEVLKTLSKYYVVDFGIRDIVIPNKDANRGRILENFVYLELIKKGYQVFTGKIGRDLEIDFIVKKNNIIKYIQVTESLIDPKTRERETRPFYNLKDNYERIIVSLDELSFTSSMYEHYNLIDFIEYI